MGKALGGIGKVAGGLTGGKGGGKGEAAPASPTVVNNSNPALDAYLADQANQTQMAMQQQQMNANLMNAQQTPQQQTPQQQPGMHVAQVQEQQGLEQPQQPGRDVWATIDALRGVLA